MDLNEHKPMVRDILAFYFAKAKRNLVFLNAFAQLLNIIIVLSAIELCKQFKAPLRLHIRARSAKSSQNPAPILST